MLGYRLRRYPNIETALSERLVFLSFAEFELIIVLL